MSSLVSINPKDQEEFASFSCHGKDEIEEILNSTNNSQEEWAKTPIDQRKESILFVKKLLLENKDELAKIATNEMGKLYRESIAEVEKCAKLCQYYYDEGAEQLADQKIEIEFSEAFIAHRPLGVILTIMPWNFPYWQVFRVTIPALLAGNGVLLKHSSNVTGCAKEIENIMKKSGLPDHLFRVLLLEGHKEIETIVKSPIIQGVSLTGSTQAGRSLGSLAASHLKKTVLELGGSDPYIILEDANLEQAANACVKSRFLNCGQSCIAAKRWIVVESVKADFTKLVKDRVLNITHGDPMDENTDIGPMARIDLRDELHKQVLESIQAGAKLLTGGVLPAEEGSYYPAPLLDNVTPGMPAFDQELFGPVASIITAKDEKEAIELANMTYFGLGAAIFTQNIEKGRNIAVNEMMAGNVFVNDFVKSDPRLPFGGIKESGYGRELSHIGIKEFVNQKTVLIK